MVFNVIHNNNFNQPAGFTAQQFRKLDQLYCRAASDKTLTYRAVDCDFDAGIATYTYYKSSYDAPFLQFIIRKIGPQSTMFEIYKQAKGRVYKSGTFDRALAYIQDEIETLRPE